MKQTPVLIIGAGPTGLMMACQLTIHDVPFIIVEKDPAATTESRAIGLQARTLEIFRQMGIVEKFLEDGQPSKAINFVIKGKIRQNVPLSSFGANLTQYPFLLMHEQGKTEKNLLDFLKKHEKHISYNTQVLSLTNEGDEVKAVTKMKTGEEETITARWVIGADGAHSIVRHTLNIPFAGNTYKQSLFVLDCHVTSELPKDELAVTLSDNYFAALFPMKNNQWRVVGELPEKLGDNTNITFEDVEKDFAKRMQMPIKLTGPTWIAAYHSHHRCVATFHQDNFFLIGDAAHIHSPVGAQGMNTGLQDAYNLAWKLAYVYHKKAKPKLLDTINGERLVFAHKLVQTVDKLFSLIVSPNKLESFIRLHILPRLLHFLVTHNKTSKFMFRTVSQIGINYRKGPLAQNASFGEFSEEAPLPGDRLPYILYEENKKNIQTLITPKQFHLLVFSGFEGKTDEIEESIKDYASLTEVTNIPLSKETEVLYEKFGLKKGFYLVRPDMYIAFRNDGFDTENLLTYLSRYFIA